MAAVAETGRIPASKEERLSHSEMAPSDECPIHYVSPQCRLVCQEACCLPHIHHPFPGLTLEIIPVCSVRKECRMSFADANMPLLFSLCLSGAGHLRLQGQTDFQPHTQGQLAVFFHPGRAGEILFHAEDACFVNLSVTPDTLRHYVPGPLPDMLKHLLRGEHDTHLAVLTATVRLLDTARHMLTPPVGRQACELYLRGACLTFMAMTMDTMHNVTSMAPSRMLTRTDIQQFTRVKAYLESNLESPPTIEQLSRMFYLNTFKLKSGFKRIYGMTIAAYVQHCRVSVAHRRFMQGDTNVSQCAWQVGYTNVSHFIAAFRRQYGCTPGEFIRRQKEALTLRTIERNRDTHARVKPSGFFDLIH